MNSPMVKRWVVLVLLIFGSGVAVDLQVVGGTARQQPGAFKPEARPIPAGLPTYEDMVIPGDNPMTPEKVALGRQLFFDKRLSADGTRACYSCHLNENGLTDGRPLAIGALGKKLPRHSPTLWNIGYHK